MFVFVDTNVRQPRVLLCTRVHFFVVPSLPLARVLDGFDNVIFQASAVHCYKQHLNSVKVDFDPFCIAENTKLLLWHETKLFFIQKVEKCVRT